MIDQNLDRPEESGAADVTLVSRGITVPVCVEVSSTGLVVVRPSPGSTPTPRQTGLRRSCAASSPKRDSRHIGGTCIHSYYSFGRTFANGRSGRLGSR